nr:copper amine oxidase N-terminal domain-containing protein [Tumebacillus amylolyticus]
MNNAPVNFPDAKPYIDENDRTMVPVRFIAEGMGAKVDWFELTQTVVINMNGKDIRLHIGEDTATVNGTPSQLDTKTVKRNDRTYVPLRFVSETLGASVFWFGEQNVVSISFADNQPGTNTGGQTGGNINDVPKPVGDINLVDVKDIDPWGRKVRTTNLPKNASDYPYILEGVSNDMYEMKFGDVFGKGTPKSPNTLYTTRKDEFTKKHIDTWLDRVRKHYQLVLNVDYRTLTDDWANQIAETTSASPEDVWKGPITDYIKWAKENEIQIEGSLEPEPSMIYHDGFSSYHVRSKIKYRVIHYNEKQKVFYDSSYNLPPCELGVWYSGYVDVAIGGGSISGYLGDDVFVSGNATITRDSWIQKQ